MRMEYTRCRYTGFAFLLISRDTRAFSRLRERTDFGASGLKTRFSSVRGFRRAYSA